ncbi:SPOR domain-containing protein [Novosphingobium fuchskuhlense]|uniref:SPOR domain-containing protein n=1 Tax=Novosphingobium fuchskuhlense TaxID=1117702 RepID=UPI0009EC2ECD|nr:SPOR domain-containing protein [Novosphingobium fuchskuhlense]
MVNIGTGEGDENEGLPINPAAWGEDAQHAAEQGLAAVHDEAQETADSLFEGAPAERLALGDEERLPWLESAEDVDFDEPGPDNSRLIGFGVLAVLLLAALVGGIYWFSHRGAAPAAADGSLIAASKEPYKVAPKDPGGKTFEGTGDASFKVSEGEKPAANLAGSAAPAATPAPAAKPTAAAAAPAAPAAPASGVGVQVGAFSTNASAEAAWAKLSAAHAALSGLSHRVVEGKADMATVFRLQAVTGDLAAANALCAKLQAGGLKCQVKR